MKRRSYPHLRTVAKEKMFNIDVHHAVFTKYVLKMNVNRVGNVHARGIVWRTLTLACGEVQLIAKASTEITDWWELSGLTAGSDVPSPVHENKHYNEVKYRRKHMLPISENEVCLILTPFQCFCWIESNCFLSDAWSALNELNKIKESTIIYLVHSPLEKRLSLPQVHLSI